jgi:hypothetical protein
MRQFKDFGIETLRPGFVGDKIKIERILNREIIIHEFRIEESKYNGKCLYLQIGIGEVKYVVFSGSRFLIEMIQKVPISEFPFKSTIIKTNDHFEFS